MKKIILALCLIGLTNNALASELPYQLPITRDGETKIRVAYNFWSGEYPGPVINVTDETSIVAYESLRKLDKKVVCTIKEGLYHPWSQTDNSIINLYSLTALNAYKAKKDFTATEAYYNYDVNKLVDYKKGDILTNVVYLSEGWCTAVLLSGDKKEKVELFCDADMENFEILSQDWDYGEQWLYLQCAEGNKAFISDMDLLDSPKVKEGKIGGYGEVFSSDN